MNAEFSHNIHSGSFLVNSLWYPSLVSSGNSCCIVLYYNGFIFPGRECLRVPPRDSGLGGMLLQDSSMSPGSRNSTYSTMEHRLPRKTMVARRRTWKLSPRLLMPRGGLPPSLPSASRPLAPSTSVGPMKFLRSNPPPRLAAALFTCPLNPLIMRARASQSGAPRSN